MTRARAYGKIILFGEHAVVYGRPAIAVPFTRVQATAELLDSPEGPPGEIWIEAQDIGFSARLSETSEDHPLGLILRLGRRELGLEEPPALRLRISSAIPVASGLGSGAAVSVAILRALAQHFGRTLRPERLSALAFEVERIHHGTPSGIDNTVIAYERPVFFTRGKAMKFLRIGAPFHLLVADSGVPSPTAEAVALVRREWEARRGIYEARFDEVGAIVEAARKSIEGGHPESLGPLMDRNQSALDAMGVVTPPLRGMLSAAVAAGAMGAKISGAGLGGNLIALVRPERADAIAQALASAGAQQVILTEVSG
jgi:mevalonate kinase